MNWSNLFWIFYAAAHTAAAIFDEVLELEMIGIRQAGPWAWVVPGVCLILLTLDLTGRLSLRGSGGKMLAALVLPLLCSCGEVLLWDDHIPERTAPAVCACVYSLLLLAAYALLRREEPKNPLAEAEALLEQGSTLGIVEGIWLLLMAGAVIFMATFGLLISLIVGGLIMSRNGLLDYGGMKGLLLGLLALHLVQALTFRRSLRAAKEKDFHEIERWSALLLWVPIVNLIWAGRLRNRLWNQRMERENPAWRQL